jgi:hypothetical protein
MIVREQGAVADGFRRGPARGDADGVRVVETSERRKSAGLVALALVLALATAVVAVRWLRPPPDQPPPVRAAAAAAPEERERANLPAPSLPGKARPVRAAKPAPAPPAEAPPEREDPLVGVGPPGTGMALFPPPGTEPLRSGILVPEDFPLPEGYVRHHQATDDGESLPAILMFHPDYEWVDDAGRKLAIPADRIVPPELAPPGLPIRMLELPGSTREPDTAP